jgi:DNA-binding response OmpR family regulator
MTNNQTSVAPRVLVADDEDIFRRSTVDILIERGYDAIGVSDVGQGMDAVQRGGFDLIISDIRMNGNLNFEFIREIIQCKRETPLMIVTGYPSIQSAIESIRLSITDYLIKPIPPDEFLLRVQTALRRGHGLSETNCSECRGIFNDTPTFINKQPSSDPMTLERIMNDQIHEMYRAMEGLYHATRLASGQASGGTKDLCQFSKCSNLDRHRSMLKETVAVLVKTKNSFKSKELAELRERIEELLSQEQ